MIDLRYDLIVAVAEKKVNFYNKDKLAYFISSSLAGMYVGICMVLINVMAASLGNIGSLKMLQGVSFAAALSLVVFAGAELFTGNVFVMFAGVKCGAVKFSDALGLTVFCYIGNLAGSIFIASLFLWTGFLQGPVLTAVSYAIDAKTNPVFMELFFRGILCNIFVCLAVWCAYRMTSESGKFIAILCCIYIFVVCGFEHSIANMTLFSMGLVSRGEGIASLGSMLNNLAASSLGNLLGGLMLSLAYWTIGRRVPPVAKS